MGKQLSVEDQAKNMAWLHPLSIYPTTAGVLVLTLNALELSVLTSSIGIVALLVGGGCAVFNRYVNINKFIEQANLKYHEEQKANNISRIVELSHDLDKQGRRDICKQLDRLVAKVDTFNSLLQDRFKGGGLAYSRFLGISDTIYNNTLKSYDEIVLILRQSASIDDKDAARTVRKLLDEGATRNDPTVRNLLVRIGLKEELATKVDNILLLTEEAITKLDLTMNSFTDLSTEKEVSWAMEQLTDLSRVLSNNHNRELQ